MSNFLFESFCSSSLQPVLLRSIVKAIGEGFLTSGVPPSPVSEGVVAFVEDKVGVVLPGNRFVLENFDGGSKTSFLQESERGKNVN